MKLKKNQKNQENKQKTKTHEKIQKSKNVLYTVDSILYLFSVYESILEIVYFSFCRYIFYFTRTLILNTLGTVQQILCRPKQMKEFSPLTSPPSHPQARIWSFAGCRPQTFCGIQKSWYSQHAVMLFLSQSQHFQRHITFVVYWVP